jgi:hypothetical protein
VTGAAEDPAPFPLRPLGGRGRSVGRGAAMGSVASHAQAAIVLTISSTTS